MSTRCDEKGQGNSQGHRPPSSRDERIRPSSIVRSALPNLSGTIGNDVSSFLSFPYFPIVRILLLLLFLHFVLSLSSDVFVGRMRSRDVRIGTRVYRSKELQDEHRGADAVLRNDRRWRSARVCGSNLSGKFGNGLLFSEGELRFVSIPTVVSSGACTCRCSCFSIISRTLIHSSNSNTNLFKFVLLAAEEYDLVAIFPTARFHVRSSHLSFLRFIRTLSLTQLLYYALRVYARGSLLKLSFPSAF